MYFANKPFTTTHKRLSKGDPVAKEDCNSDDHFERLIELGYIVKAAPAADPEPEPVDPA